MWSGDGEGWGGCGQGTVRNGVNGVRGQTGDGLIWSGDGGDRVDVVKG